ncbi:unnamed protein product [Clonostachys rosea f. rosea IK726]|uniref:MICOS complex subunit MIC12 n=2 Tax=Bionectria ochroleuca TaxID=29856 RepID=A0A0B7JZ32_BIOOC|nr:unnamed protein product [Clonostachys rosea f. rosea IK726]
MGFASGFTGGVALTLSVAYLSVLAHQRNREQQGASLRAQAIAIHGLIDPLPAPLPPTRSEVAAAQRLSSIEVAKDRWNYEVENAVRWVQRSDWSEIREGVEDGISNLWANTFGEAPAEGAQKVNAKAVEAREGVAAAAQNAYTKAAAQARSVEQAAEDKILEARLRANRQAVKVETAVKEKASEAKGVLASAIEAGKETANALLGRVEAESEASPVARALEQRYAQPEAKVNKTVAEVLRERYTPFDERDNTLLRGV